MITRENVEAAWRARCAARRPVEEQLAQQEDGTDPIQDHLDRIGIDVDVLGEALSTLFVAYGSRSDLTLNGVLGTFFLEGVELGVRAARREQT